MRGRTSLSGVWTLSRVDDERRSFAWGSGRWIEVDGLWSRPWSNGCIVWLRCDAFMLPISGNESERCSRMSEALEGIRRNQLLQHIPIHLNTLFSVHSSPIMNEA